MLDSFTQYAVDDIFDSRLSVVDAAPGGPSVAFVVALLDVLFTECPVPSVNALLTAFVCIMPVVSFTRALLIVMFFTFPVALVTVSTLDPFVRSVVAFGTPSLLVGAFDFATETLVGVLVGTVIDKPWLGVAVGFPDGMVDFGLDEAEALALPLVEDDGGIGVPTA